METTQFWVQVGHDGDGDWEWEDARSPHSTLEAAQSTLEWCQEYVPAAGYRIIKRVITETVVS